MKLTKMLAMMLCAGCIFPTQAGSFSLPIWKEKAEALGYTLPRPFGIDVNYMHIQQGIIVDSIALQGLEFLQLDAKPGKQKSDVVTLRADMWLFPFLNLYAVAGKLTGYSSTDVTLKLGSLLEVPINDFRLDLDGITAGAGVVLVGGYKNWFGLVDASYTQTKLTVIDGNIDAVVISPRVGYDFTSAGLPLRVWAGAMYQNVTQNLSGSLSDLGLPSSLNNLLANGGRFDVVQHLETSWNPLVGLQYALSDSWYLLGEFGFGGRKSAFLSVDWRF